METKGLTCKLPLELHDKISEEIKAGGVKKRKFIHRFALPGINLRRIEAFGAK